MFKSETIRSEFIIFENEKSVLLKVKNFKVWITKKLIKETGHEDFRDFYFKDNFKFTLINPKQEKNECDAYFIIDSMTSKNNVKKKEIKIRKAEKITSTIKEVHFELFDN